MLLKPRFILAAALVLIAPLSAAAQTPSRFVAGVSAGIAQSWDEESMLGRGVLTEGRAGIVWTPKTRLELTVTHLPYERHFDSGVTFDGRSIFTGIGLKHDFTSGRVRPFVLAGAGMNRHRGTTTHPSTPTFVTSTTDLGYMAGTGFVVTNGRWEAGPEARGYLMSIDNDSSAALILTGSVRASIRF